jgi:ribosomal-protein-serine acetyltransferase
MSLFPLELGEGITLRPLEETDAEAMYQAVLRNRDHLDPWMRWSGRVQTVDDARAYIHRYVVSDGFHAGIWQNGQLIGGIAYLSVDHNSNKAEIGYWLSQTYVGKGLVTRACRAVITHLFSVEKLHRLEIQAVVDNVRSRAVAERLGFTLEGIKRESEWITDAYRDHALYSLLEQDWKPSL